MRKKAASPPVADGKWRLDDDNIGRHTSPQPSPSSDWLNHATGGPATRDIFTPQRHDKKRRLALLAAGAAGSLAGDWFARADLATASCSRCAGAIGSRSPRSSPCWSRWGHI